MNQNLVATLEEQTKTQPAVGLSPQVRVIFLRSEEEPAKSHHSHRISPRKSTVTRLEAFHHIQERLILTSNDATSEFKLLKINIMNIFKGWAAICFLRNPNATSLAFHPFFSKSSEGVSCRTEGRGLAPASGKRQQEQQG